MFFAGLLNQTDELCRHRPKKNGLGRKTLNKKGMPTMPIPLSEIVGADKLAEPQCGRLLDEYQHHEPYLLETISNFSNYLLTLRILLHEAGILKQCRPFKKLSFSLIVIISVFGVEAKFSNAGENTIVAELDVPSRCAEWENLGQMEIGFVNKCAKRVYFFARCQLPATWYGGCAGSSQIRVEVGESKILQFSRGAQITIDGPTYTPFR